MQIHAHYNSDSLVRVNSFSLPHEVSKLLFNGHMKPVDQIRLENLAQLRMQYGSIAALNEALGRRRNDSTLAALLRQDIDPKTGKVRKIGHAIARGIEQIINLDTGWMDTDHTEPRMPEALPSQSVPLISWVVAGHWTEVEDPYAVGDAEDWLPCPRRHGSRTYALRVEGLSMNDPRGKLSFSEGDIIFVDPDRDAVHGDLVVVRLDDEVRATFKRLLIDGERKYLEALNPDWPERIFPINGNATLCGVVIGRFEPF